MSVSPFLELPPLQLNISTSGYTEVGQSLNMTCSVRVVEGLVQQPNVTWTKMDDVSMGDLDELNITTITVIDGSITNVTVMLDPVLFEHRGMYICIAEYNISLTYDADSNSQEYIIIVYCKSFNFFTSSPFSLTVSSSPSFIIIVLVNILCALSLIKTLISLHCN